MGRDFRRRALHARSNTQRQRGALFILLEATCGTNVLVEVLTSVPQPLSPISHPSGNLLHVRPFSAVNSLICGERRALWDLYEMFAAGDGIAQHDALALVFLDASRLCSVQLPREKEMGIELHLKDARAVLHHSSPLLASLNKKVISAYWHCRQLVLGPPHQPHHSLPPTRCSKSIRSMLWLLAARRWVRYTPTPVTPPNHSVTVPTTFSLSAAAAPLTQPRRRDHCPLRTCGRGHVCSR